ncbi:MAG: TRAP transporter substrate-binding protein [Syntrophomonadaceae bacterium]|nr:TRAP transporter substrate-binding protein [Syntrophomonadaceae bacterium]
MKKILCLLLVVALMVSVVGCAPAAQQPAPPPAAEIQKIEISMATAFAEAHIVSDVAKKFKELAEAKSNGNVKVNLFLAGAMGNEEDIMKAVTAGAIQGQTGGGIPINAYAPPFYFLDTPFVMKDWNHIMAIWNGELGAKMLASMEAAGNTTLAAPIYRGLRHFTSKKPVVTPEDLKGIKLRLPVLPTWVAVWTEVGASTVPIPLGELYTALATGVADASEGDLTQIHGFKLNEVQSHLSLTGHLVSLGLISFNTKWLNGLNEKTRNLVLESAKEAAAWGSSQMKAKEEQVIKDLERLGMTVVQADRAAFLNKGMPAIERLFNTQFRVTTLKEVQSYAK